MNIFNLVIPWYVRWIALLSLCAVLGLYCWLDGAANMQSKWDKEKQDQQLAQMKEAAERSAITAKSAAQADMSKQLIQKTAKAIAEQLEIKYVTPSDDAKCVVPIGVFRMRNDTAATYMPIPHGTR